MRYQHSNALALALTISQQGNPVYGEGNNVWYYEAEGILPTHQRGSIVHQRPFKIRFYTGDCNLGAEALMIAYDGVAKFRDCWENELRSATLRSSIEHQTDGMVA